MKKLIPSLFLILSACGGLEDSEHEESQIVYIDTGNSRRLELNATFSSGSTSLNDTNDTNGNENSYSRSLVRPRTSSASEDMPIIVSPETRDQLSEYCSAPRTCEVWIRNWSKSSMGGDPDPDPLMPVPDSEQSSPIQAVLTVDQQGRVYIRSSKSSKSKK